MDNYTNKNYSFLMTISNTKQLISRREIEQADKARHYQELLGWPSTAEYLRIVDNNLVSNCDINADDIKRSLAIYGEPLPVLKGKMTRKTPKSHGELVKLPLPEELHEKRIDLYVDVFYTAGQAFLLAKSGRIQFYSV